ncbi:MAG: O-methyltransferase [Bacillota bacterium]
MNITNEIISAYIDNLYVNENAKLEELREFAESRHVPIILKDTEKLLKVIMKLKEPARVLEIGTAVGYSSCVFADCCGCRVVTVESDEDSAKAARANIENLGFDHLVEVIHGDARDVLASMDGEEKFDILFIDAAKSHYREFWDLAMPLMKKDSMVICDNVLMKGMTASDEYDERGRYRTSITRMRDFIEYINGLDYADTAVLPVGDGVSISLIETD